MKPVELIASGIDWNKTAAIAYLDISKALDRVCHEGLIYKMNQLGLPVGLVKIIHSFLEERTFKVRLENYESSMKTITVGVPHGSVMSPVLYIIFALDIALGAQSRIGCPSGR